MVAWKRKTRQSPRRGEINLWVGTSDSVTWDGVSRDAVDCWVRLWKQLSLKTAASETWMTVLCRFYPDSGSVYCEPANLPYSKQIGRENVSAHFPFIEQLWYSQPDGKACPELFDQEHANLMRQFVEVWQGALLSHEASVGYHEVAAGRPIEIVRVEYDDMTTAVRMTRPA